MIKKHMNINQIFTGFSAALLFSEITELLFSGYTGTNKSYISMIENAKGNIPLSILIRIFEKGLNRKIGLTFL